MTTATTRVSIDWGEIAVRRTLELRAMAVENGIRFTDPGAARIVAISLREDARRAIEHAQAIVATLPPRPIVRRGTITAIGVVELFGPDGPYLLLRRGDEAWLVPDVPNGWELRVPWMGDQNSVRWIGGPPAMAAFRRVGATI